MDNENNFFETLLSKSFFSEDRIIVIKRVTDKLFNIIEKIDPTKLEDVNIIINAGNLEKNLNSDQNLRRIKNMFVLHFIQMMKKH